MKARGLNANQLKLFVVFGMMIDHAAWLLWPGYDYFWAAILCHTITRPGTTIMWFFIAEGYFHTKDLRKYILRLAVCALVSHFAFTFAWGIPVIPFTNGFLNQTSVIVGLLCGLLMLVVADSESIPLWEKILLISGLCLVSVPADWSCIAPLAILMVGRNRGSFRKQMSWMALFIVLYSVILFIFADRVYALIQLAALFSIPLLKCYNGEPGKQWWMRWLFYSFYPLHLAVIGIIRVLIVG